MIRYIIQSYLNNNLGGGGGVEMYFSLFKYFLLHKIYLLPFSEIIETIQT